jgi:hypothetical protein
MADFVKINEQSNRGDELFPIRTVYNNAVLSEIRRRRFVPIFIVYNLRFSFHPVPIGFWKGRQGGDFYRNDLDDGIIDVAGILIRNGQVKFYSGGMSVHVSKVFAHSIAPPNNKKTGKLAVKGEIDGRRG